MDIDIYNDISHETARNHHDNKNLAERLRRRVKRKFGILLHKQDVEEVIHTTTEIYNYAAKQLPNYLLPTTTGYSEPQFVKRDILTDDISQKFQDHDLVTLSAIIEWVIYWEYLR